MTYLTPSERYILGCLYNFREEHDRLPSSSELADDIAERSRIVGHLRQLETKGYIKRPGEGGPPRASSWRHGALTQRGLFAGVLFSELPKRLKRSRRLPRPYRGRGTKFSTMVRTAPSAPGTEGLRVLKSGGNNTKIGSRVLRGKWAGAPIYCLTLEERTTCPRGCDLWTTCYGNNMHRAIRYEVNAALYDALRADLAKLRPVGRHLVVVRLHVLGDFVGREYVDFWRNMLNAWSGLRLFGYTAWPRHSQMGKWLVGLDWDRAAIRFSGGTGPFSALVRGVHKERAKTFPCPVERGTSPSCGACTACWETKKTVVFEPH